MTKLHPSLLTAHALGIGMPRRMARLPLTEAGWPALYFATAVNGKVDLRIADLDKFVRCIKRKLCWLCGEPLGRNMAFAIGPMCLINRISAEPPAHCDCAGYAVRVCPFMVHPNAHRRKKDMPEDSILQGVGLERNPGVTALWVTEKYETFSAEAAQEGNGGVLLLMGRPTAITWWARGRIATGEEVRYSINAGLPTLTELAQRQGPESEKLLALQIAEAQQFIPA